jgi:hypothetical protein
MEVEAQLLDPYSEDGDEIGPEPARYRYGIGKRHDPLTTGWTWDPALLRWVKTF